MKTRQHSNEELLSIGRISTRMQRPVNSIEKLATRLGITPRFTLNGISYFAADDADRISRQVNISRNGKND